MAARLLMGRRLHHMSPLSSLRCACTLRETVRAARKRVRSSRESPRASAATHTQRERERGEWQHASSWDGSCITCLLSPLCHACACTLRETVGAARKRDGYGAAERACGPLQPHTRRERESCLLYTSDAADEEDSVDLGGRRIIKKKKKKKKDE